jgi:hypothetical protein
MPRSIRWPIPRCGRGEPPFEVLVGFQLSEQLATTPRDDLRGRRVRVSLIPAISPGACSALGAQHVRPL